jgi:hypothetical protein
VISASAPGPDGTRIGFGEVTGRILQGDRGGTISTGIRLARRRALDIEAGWTVEDAQATGWPNDHHDRVEARGRAIQGTLGVNPDALPREGRL